MKTAQLTNEAKKKKLIHRLSRAAGQLNAVREMIENEADCKAIATQLSAARAALDKTYFEMMACAIEKSLQDTIDDNWQDELETLTGVLVKYA